jgi:hypothetical protein
MISAFQNLGLAMRSSLHPRSIVISNFFLFKPPNSHMCLSVSQSQLLYLAHPHVAQ